MIHSGPDLKIPVQGLEYAIKQATTHYAQGQSKPLVELDQFVGSLPLCELDALIGTFHSPGWCSLGQAAQVLCTVKYKLRYTNYLFKA